MSMRNVGNKVFLMTVVGVLLVLEAFAPFPGHAADKPLVMGVLPVRSAAVTTEMYKPIAEYLSRQLGREVQLDTAKDFGTFWTGVTQKRYDIVHYNQYHYVKSHKLYGYDAILRNEENGEEKSSGSIIARKDSGLRVPLDLMGKKIVMGGAPDAMMGAVIPRYILKNAELTERQYKVEHSKDPVGSVLAVFSKKADAGGVDSSLLRSQAVKDQGVNPDELVVLLQSIPVYSLPWAVKDDMAPELRVRIQDLMAGLSDSPEGMKLVKGIGCTKLAKANNADFDVHRQIIQDALGEEY